jgi:hypothetical protein
VRDVVKFISVARTTDSMHRTSMAYTTGDARPCIEQAVYAQEFYQAAANGYRPEVRIKVNRQEYNGEPRMEYKDRLYSVIRTEKAPNDWLIIIGQSVVNEEARDV